MTTEKNHSHKHVQKKKTKILAAFWRIGAKTTYISLFYSDDLKTGFNNTYCSLTTVKVKGRDWWYSLFLSRNIIKRPKPAALLSMSLYVQTSLAWLWHWAPRALVHSEDSNICVYMQYMCVYFIYFKNHCTCGVLVFTAEGRCMYSLYCL